MYGITYNGKHSFNDLELIVLNTRVVEAPSKVKIIETIPFSNITYDFSNLYGNNCYNERVLEYEFLIKANKSTDLDFKRMVVENWLLGSSGKSQLYDDDTRGYFYNAECIKTDFEDLGNIGKLKAIFNAYPFKIKSTHEGEDIWDTFNFELDMLQETLFEVNGSKTITLYNEGAIDIEPYVITTSDFKVTLDGKEYSFKEGTTKTYIFKLKRGANELTLSGNGSIEFKFRKEVL